MKAIPSRIDLWGLIIASLIISLWTASLFFLLSIHISYLLLPVVPILALGQTFLYTGLFVTAHDAMHESVCPNYPRLNTATGTLALLLYGLLPYRRLFHAHIQHHCYPASALDPDFCQDQRSHVFRWYLDFLWRHKSNYSILGLAASYCLAHVLFKMAHVNLIVFWIIPSLLSSFQLFYFGTFLAHKEPVDGYKTPRRAQTIERSFLWSLISCYHFGYHDEHHQYPEVPWWYLRKFSRLCTC